MNETILKGIDPKTAVIDIECKVGAGEKYNEIKDVVDIKTKQSESIPHKEG